MVKIIEPVKINELEKTSWNNIDEENDLLLKSHLFDGSIESFLKKNIDQNSFYSDSLTFEKFFIWILQNNQHIIKRWIFNSKENPPLQLSLFDAKNFFDLYFKKKENIGGLINNSGLYKSTYFQNASDTIIDSSNANKYSIANLDYVNRIIAMIYDKLRDSIHLLLKMFIEINGNLYYEPSYIGQIIHGTDRIVPSKTGRIDQYVRQIYGDGSLIFKLDDLIEIRKPNTTWILHKDEYSLAASSTNIISGSNGLHKDDGNNSLVDTPLIKHDHDVEAHGHTSGGKITGSVSIATFLTKFIGGNDKSGSGSVSSIPPEPANKTTPTCTSVNKSCSGSSFSINNYTGDSTLKIDIQQAYKYCYIWERVS